MPFCAKCGKEHTEEDIYCSRCGASLKARGDAVTEAVDIESGVGQTEVMGLLNANAKDIKIGGGVGQIKLGFTGKSPEADTHVRIEAGIGGFKLEIDKDVPAVIRVNGLAGVDLRGAVRTRSRSFGSGVYETGSYTDDGPTLDIRVSMGLGGLTIRTV